MLNKHHLDDVNWQLEVVVKKIIALGGVFDSITFYHIPREQKKVENGLTRWASKQMGTWDVDDQGSLLGDLSQVLEDFIMEVTRVQPKTHKFMYKTRE